MAINNTKPRPTIGVDYYHYAPIIADTPQGILYDTAVPVFGQTAMAYTLGSSSNPFYADNGIYENDISLGDQVVTTTHADIPNDIYYDMIGGDYNGALNLGSGFVAKERGCLFRKKHSGGFYQYFRFWKGTYTPPDQNGETQAESVSYQTQEVTYNALTAQGKDWFVQIIYDNDPNVLDMGITPQMLAENIIDFNWDPFTGNSAFAPAIKLKSAPPEIIAMLTDGSVAKPVLLGLVNAVFENTISATEITATNLPAGLTVGTVVRLSENMVSVTLAGTATSHTAADSVNDVSFTVAQTGIAEASAPETSPDMSLTFK